MPSQKRSSPQQFSNDEDHRHHQQQCPKQSQPQKGFSLLRLQSKASERYKAFLSQPFIAGNCSQIQEISFQGNSHHKQGKSGSLTNKTYKRDRDYKRRCQTRLTRQPHPTTNLPKKEGKTMLKVPDHQVAGHQAGGGKLGPLVDDSGHFYKPLQSDERGSQEVAFYTAFSTDTRIPDHFRKFFPVFHGTKLLEASDGCGLYPHLALEDIVSGRTHPCILDAKIGARTWYPQAAEDYLQKCLKKDRETACLELGFRISGLQVYGNKLTGLWKPDRHVIQSGSVDDSKLALRKFVSSNPSTDSDIKPDCSCTSTVYGGPDGILAQLLVLKSWFEEQTFYHFYSCSVLMVYDKESILQGKNRGAQVKLVDFAHVIDGRGVIDHNFLGGLCSLIKMITDIVTSPST